MSKTSTTYQKTLNPNLHELYDVATKSLKCDDAGPEGCVRLWWTEVSATPNVKPVYVIDYSKKKGKGRRFRRISTVPVVCLPEIKPSAIEEYNITVTGHLEFAGMYHHNNSKFRSTSVDTIGPLVICICMPILLRRPRVGISELPGAGLLLVCVEYDL